MSNSSIVSPGKAKESSRRPWQGDRSGTGDILGLLWRRSRQFLWGALLIASLLLFAWLIWLLLPSPKRTPLVVLSAAPYAWPLPPNAWASEDFQKLGVMDGETITLRGSDAPVFKASDFFEQLDREIKRSEGQSHRLPLIVWVSLHGVAEDAAGAIHLVPPKASPTNPDSWIDLDAIFDRMAKLDPNRKALLILDCNRMQVNWNIGLLANQFAGRVQVAFRERFADRKQAGNLAVLLSAGPGEESYVSPELGGSVFGHYLQLGLAGVADRTVNDGNGDGWVDVDELHRYVQQQVQWWATQSRQRSQKPIMLSARPKADFRLARSLNEELLDQLVNRQPPRKSGPTNSGQRLDALWRSLDGIRSQHLYQREPIAFRNLEHELLWLEQLSTAGKGYQTLAKRTLDRVSGEVKAIETRMTQLSQNRTYVDSYSLMSGNRPPLPRSLRVHSLPLAEFFGTQDADSSTELRDQLNELKNLPNTEILSRTYAEFEEKAKSEFASTHFIRMLDRYQTPGLWQRTNSVSKLLSLQSMIGDFSVPRDASGMPADIRVHRWNRVLLSLVDESRRNAEDSVFLRQQNGLDEHLAETQSRFQDSLRAASLAEQAMQICDRAMAVTPYYAQWITHPNRRVAPDETKAEVDNVILPLIADAKELSRKLADVPNESADPRTVIDRIEIAQTLANEKIEPILASLQNALTQQKRQLIIQANSNRLDAIGEVQAVLSVPLIDWKSRRDLRAALHELLVRVHQNLEAPSTDLGAPSAKESEVPETTKTGYAAEIESWNRHPLTLLLFDQEGDSGNRGRNRIASFLELIQRQLEGRRSESTLEGQRDLGSVAARQARAAAAIWFPQPEQDPIAELRTIDIASLLMWHGKRVLADFWGPAGQPRSFFDLAASDYCDSVAEMDRWRADPAIDGSELIDVRDAKSRLEASRRFLPEWLRTSAGRTIQLAPSDDVPSTFTVSSESDAGFDAPSGTAVIAVRSQKHRIDFEQIKPSDAVVLPTSDARYEVVLPADVADSGIALKAQTIFRGHEYGGLLNVEQLGGVKIDVKQHRYAKSEVTLNGPWDELSVVFVLDCSASMNESLSGETDAGQSRIEVAKAALQEMLFDLGLRRNIRVGVQAFGHRLGWSVDEPVKALTRPDFTGLIDPALTPGQDVESMLMLGAFDLTAAKSIVPEIANLKPWGQSPLYLSVMQSIQEFSTADDQADRHVIVITDGANYQFIPPSVANVGPTSDDDVRQAWMRNQVPVHILGLGMDRTEQAEAVQEFDKLSRDTGGRFQALGSSTDLAQALRNLLAPGMYRLLSYQDDPRPETTTTLGMPTQVIPVPKTPELFGLRYLGRQLVDPEANESDQTQRALEPIILEGGEAYQLYVNESGMDIYDYPHDDNVVAISTLVTSQRAPTEHIVRIHRPGRPSPNRVMFPVSWQRREPISPTDRPLWRATRRPSAVWIQIQPVGPGGKSIGQEYTFIDSTFEPSEPVPVMNLEASHWPEDATRARVQLWSRAPEESTTIELLPPAIGVGERAVSNRLNTTINISEASFEPVEVVPGVTLRMDPLGSQFIDGIARRRYVVEFDDANAPVTSIKLSLSDSIGKELIRIVRQFDPEHQMSVHTFYYPSRKNESPRQIIVTNRDHEIDGAWQLEDEFLEVAIPDAGGLLPVGGGRGK